MKSTTCFKCNVCRSICINGALPKDHHYSGYFNPSKCINCGNCRTACISKSIKIGA